MGTLEQFLREAKCLYGYSNTIEIILYKLTVALLPDQVDVEVKTSKVTSYLKVYFSGIILFLAESQWVGEGGG